MPDTRSNLAGHVSSGLRRLAARYLGCEPETVHPRELAAFLKPVRLPLSVSYCDLRGINALGDHLDPEELRSLLDQHLAGITDAVGLVDGFVDTIDGNGVLAGYGAPHRH
ncbi:MAG: hypothetical protein ACOCXA_04170, partial [Planctomycetota bacterium]